MKVVDLFSERTDGAAIGLFKNYIFALSDLSPLLLFSGGRAQGSLAEIPRLKGSRREPKR